MNWNAVIERNREALKRVLAALVAMAGLASGAAFTSTLPRHLHRAVLRLLRPAEAAARRLVIVAARDVVVALPTPSRPRKPKLKPVAPVLRSLGIAVVISRADDAARAAASIRRARAPRAQIALPLFDPLRIPRSGRSGYVPAHAAPRILFPGLTTPHRLPPPPSPDDPIDAKRLGLRLEALASALDDLPKHARRFARWKMRGADAAGAQDGRSRDAGRSRRLTSLRPGRPPGLSAANRRRPTHEVYEILADLQYFALKAMQPPDTS